MRPLGTISAFSLIELLVALAILGVVAALVVPRFLSVGAQAQQKVIDANLAEIQNSYNLWTSLGGQIPTDNSDGKASFRTIQFLGRASDGSDPQRGFGPSIGVIDPKYPIDTMGTGGSWAASINVSVPNASPNVAPTGASSPDGFYGKAPNPASQITGQYVAASPDSVYEKQGSQIYAIDANLATAVFIRTGLAVGEDPSTAVPGVLK